MKSNAAIPFKDDELVGPGWPNGMQRIIKVESLEDFNLRITFESGEVRRLAVRPMIPHLTNWSAPILDPEYFKQVGIDDVGDLCWPNEFGWDWQTVYDYSVPMLRETQSKAGDDT